MNQKVISFPSDATDCESCLESMKDLGLTTVLIVGLDKEGNLYTSIHVPAGSLKHQVVGAVELLKELYYEKLGTLS